MNPRPLCPCGSGKQVNKCCLISVKGYWRTSCNITPTPPQTNYSNPKCFLAITKDCSDKISSEHYLSEGVLEQIDFMIGTEGLPWIPDGKKKTISKSNLTAHVLCTRHNSALAPLDSKGKEFFCVIKQYSVAAYDGKERVSAFNGRDIERWMLKTLYGMLASRILQAELGERIKVDIDTRCVDLLYEKIPFSPGRGLFVRTEVGHTIHTEKSIGVQPVTDRSKRTLNGLRFNMVGFDFLLTTSPVKAENSVFRPGYIVFSSHTGTKVIHLYWADLGPHPIIPFISRK